MKTTFPSALAALEAARGTPLDLQRIQDHLMRQSLQEVRGLVETSNLAIAKLGVTVERRTSVLSPTQGFTTGQYANSGKFL